MVRARNPIDLVVPPRAAVSIATIFKRFQGDLGLPGEPRSKAWATLVNLAARQKLDGLSQAQLNSRIKADLAAAGIKPGTAIATRVLDQMEAMESRWSRAHFGPPIDTSKAVAVTDAFQAALRTGVRIQKPTKPFAEALAEGARVAAGTMLHYAILTTNQKKPGPDGYQYAEGGKYVVINPKSAPVMARAKTMRAAGAHRGIDENIVTKDGGRLLKMEGGPLKNAAWRRLSLRDTVTSMPLESSDQVRDLIKELEKFVAPRDEALSAAEQKAAKEIAASKDGVRLTAPQKELVLKALARAHGIDPDKRRDALVVNTAGAPEPVVFFFQQTGETNSKGTHHGLVALCNTLTTMEFTKDGSDVGPIYTIKKPVVYLYPEKTMSIAVDVKLDGTFVAQYPKMMGGKSTGRWEVMAQPSGELFDPKTEKRYSYLFWEGAPKNAITIDRSQAYCVAGNEVEAFLEKASNAFALNEKERTDFVSFWLPAMEQNEWNVVQFLDEKTYEAFAAMTVTPEPTTVIRMFMVFERASGKVDTGAPPMPTHMRKGFTVVEWGGVNLNETK